MILGNVGCSLKTEEIRLSSAELNYDVTGSQERFWFTQLSSPQFISGFLVLRSPPSAYGVGLASLIDFTKR